MFKMRVRDDDDVEWEEEYNSRGSMEKRFLLVDSQETAEIVGKAIIKRFNDTLRPHDSRRELISAEYLGPDKE